MLNDTDFDPDFDRPRATLNALVDALDAISTTTCPDAAWIAANRYVCATGANAVNVAEFHRASGEVFWFRSSMNTDWLGDYLAQDFMDIDGLVLAARQGKTFRRMKDGVLLNPDGAVPMSGALQSQLVAWDYRMLDSYAMSTRTPETVKIVTFSRPHDAPPPTASDRLLSAVIGASIQPPVSVTSPGATPLQRPDLSVREKDVLRFLASGLRNDMIAWKTGIAEVTVRAHIASARRKLGAATREQAIAIALRSGLLAL